eukprot:13360146-Alexandrium_andersonii.AAC.1
MPERARALQVAAAVRVAPYMHDGLAGAGWAEEQIRGNRARATRRWRRSRPCRRSGPSRRRWKLRAGPSPSS